MVWGQIDSIYANLSLLALIFGLHSPVAGICLYVLALNTKAQAIVFLPAIAAVLYYSTRNFKSLSLTLFSALCTQFALLIPFISTGGMAKLWYHALHSVDLYNNLSISAFNFWYLILPDNPYFINDHSCFLLFSYKVTGLLLFSTAALLVLIPLVQNFSAGRKKGAEPGVHLYRVLFLGMGLLWMYFFYFNSQMHERYAHPMIILFFFYAVVSSDYVPYILVCIPYLLSLDKCFSFPEGYLPMYHFKIIYASRILALWYTAALCYSTWQYLLLIRKPQASAPDQTSIGH